MCDANRKFVDVFAEVCGSVRDSRMLSMSDIKRAIDDDPDPSCPRENHVLGDSASTIDYRLMPTFRDNGHLRSRYVFKSRIPIYIYIFQS